jgi:hypothetical protein
VSRVTAVIRDWRWPALVALGVIGAGVAIALLQPSPAGYLDPNGTSPVGGHALADLLTERGQPVQRVSAPAGPGGAPAGLELITSPGLLTPAQLDQAGRFGGDILLVDPDPAALRAITPRVTMIGDDSGVVAQPLCDGAAPALSGNAYLGGAVLQTGDQAARECYPNNGGFYLIQYADGPRTITVLGTGAPLTNQYLADDGDAALALNLVAADKKIVWLVPSPDALPPGSTASAGSGGQSFFDLVPWPAYLITIQLGIAVVLAAAWRARRLGPLVAERLPVVVRASETVEGHGRLYQARRARDRAAEELRAAAAARIARLTGGDAGPGPGQGISAETIAARTGQPATEIARLLHGPPPATDQDLVTLAADLDTLMRKIRQP